MAQGNGSLPEGSTSEKTYSDYLWAVREAKKEEAVDPSCSQAADNTSKPKRMSFFPYKSRKAPSMPGPLLCEWCI